MRTYNFLFTTKKCLETSLKSLDYSKASGILIRIHTCIHNNDSAVDLAKFIKQTVPKAEIFGTSCSSIIYHGKVMPDQCLISVTMLETGSVHTCLIPVFENYDYINSEILCSEVKKRIIKPNTKLLITFFTTIYNDVYNFVDKSNDIFPGIPMIGGLANTSNVSLSDFFTTSFIFNENEARWDGGIFAALSGDELEAEENYCSGVEPIGDETEITSTFGTCILEVNDTDAAEYYKRGVGDILRKNPDLTNLFPYVVSSRDNIPYYVVYKSDATLSELLPESVPYNKKYYDLHPEINKNERKDYILANHNVKQGEKIQRAFIYDKRIISDNYTMFSKISSFEKGETLFSYSCVSRSIIYSNCVKWEISPYEDTSMSGCITSGEITRSNGRNTFANCTFAVAVAGEKRNSLPLNEFALSNTKGLSSDNNLMIEYLIKIEKYYEDNKDSKGVKLLSTIRRNFETKLLYNNEKQIANSSRLLFDIKLGKIDKICVISSKSFDVFKTFLDVEISSQMIDYYTRGFMQYAEQNNINMYVGDNNKFIIGSESSQSFEEFESKMKELYNNFAKSPFKGYSPIFDFCIFTRFSADSIEKKYERLAIDMQRKDIHYLATKENINEDSFFNTQMEMVKIINYAIKTNSIIPYYQGIHNNKTGKIDLYEALMRIRGDDGTIYTPYQFLEISRDFSVLYDRISFIMISKVLNRFRDKENIKVSMNLGMEDLKRHEIVSYIFNFLSTAPHPENFIFEILENKDINDYDYLREFSKRIHKYGANIAIDDFGSGYSNLMHLIKLDFDYLKIDGEIVKVCDKEAKCESLISLLSNWKKSFNGKVKIIAEYVENKNIQDVLDKYDIDYSQGYYYSKPSNIFNE